MLAAQKLVQVRRGPPYHDTMRMNVARLKASGCDFLVLGMIIRETIGAIAEARKIGWNPTISGSLALPTPT